MAPQAKRRKVAAPVEEIVFNPNDRHQFLTGFHKRKLQRAKHAQEVAEKKAKEDRREQRRKVRNPFKTNLYIHIYLYTVPWTANANQFLLIDP